MHEIPLKMVRKLYLIFFLLSILVITIGIFIGTIHEIIGIIVILAGCAMLAGDLIFLSIFCRCPYCGRAIRFPLYNHYCPHCGNYLDINNM